MSDNHEKSDKEEGEPQEVEERVPEAENVEATEDQARFSPVKQTKPSYFLSYMKKAYLVPSDAILTAKFKPIFVEAPDDINSLLNSKSVNQWTEKLRLKNIMAVHADVDGTPRYALYTSVAVRGSTEDADDARTLRFIPPVVVKNVLKDIHEIDDEKKKRVPELFKHTFEEKQINPVAAGWGELQHVLVSNKPKQKPAKRKSAEPPEEEPVPARSKKNESADEAPRYTGTTYSISETHHLVPDHFYKELIAAYLKR